MSYHHFYNICGCHDDLHTARLLTNSDTTNLSGQIAVTSSPYSLLCSVFKKHFELIWTNLAIDFDHGAHITMKFITFISQVLFQIIENCKKLNILKFSNLHFTIHVVKQ